MKIKTPFLFFVIAMIFFLEGCSATQTQKKKIEAPKELIGEWTCNVMSDKIPSSKTSYVFYEDWTVISTFSYAGTYHINKKISNGTYKTKDDKLIMSGLYLDVESKEYTYTLSEDGKTLTLTRNGDEMVLTKVE